jgi:type II secretory ATPase GspE/PulE/Tfp pilus assembly ATPase PilB-like protein
LVASTVEAVMAQRLVRRLCTHCKQPYTPVQEDLPHDFPWQTMTSDPLYREVGCRECRQTGFRGRFGIYELLVTTDAVRQLAHDRASSWKLKEAALKEGMATLRQDGWRKTVQGHTSVQEIVMTTKSDYFRKEAS